ncbi:MAG: hypothetical protein IMZ46_04100 [Acidobacteria bacterium]|nr:hypothetical protein [Acidobacteriota bacterium]
MPNNNPNDLENRWFGILLYFYFRQSKSSNIAETAQRMGIAEDTLQKYVSGINSIPVERIPDLVHAVDDPIFIQEICDRSGYFPIKKFTPTSGVETMSVMEIQLAALCTLVDGSRKIKNECRDEKGTVDRQAYKRIHLLLYQAIGLIFSLDEKLKHESGKIKGEGE